MSIRTVIIGANQRAKKYGLILQGLLDYELVGIADLNADRVVEMARLLNLDRSQIYTDDETMLADLTPDLVIIATPPHAHCENLERILTFSPKKILSIPPLAVTADQAYSLYQLFTEHKGPQLVEAYPFLLTEWWYEVRNSIQSSRGKALSLSMSSFLRISDRYQPQEEHQIWHALEKVGGVQWKLLPPLLLCANRLTQDVPLAVYARGERGPYDTFIRLSGMIEYVHGHTVHFDIGNQMNTDHLTISDHEKQIHVLGTDWQQLMGQPAMIHHIKEKELWSKYFVPRETRMQLLKLLADNWDNQEPLSGFVSIVESCMVMYCMDAVVASALDLNEVELRIPEPLCEAYEKIVCQSS